MFHVVLDFEMCNVSREKKKEFGYGSEIIQLGAVMLDGEFHLCDSFNRYVCPVYGEVDEVIEELTGIKDKRLRREAHLPEVLKDFLQWIGDRDYDIYTWSGNDYKQLSKELKHKGIQANLFGTLLERARWIDYQKAFGKRFDYRHEVGLWEVFELTGMDFEGQEHDGYSDAYNTARIIEKLERDKEYKLPTIYRNSRFEISGAPLGFDLAGLFDGIQLEQLPATA